MKDIRIRFTIHAILRGERVLSVDHLDERMASLRVDDDALDSAEPGKYLVEILLTASDAADEKGSTQHCKLVSQVRVHPSP